MEYELTLLIGSVEDRNSPAKRSNQSGNYSRGRRISNFNLSFQNARRVFAEMTDKQKIKKEK